MWPQLSNFSILGNDPLTWAGVFLGVILFIVRTKKRFGWKKLIIFVLSALIFGKIFHRSVYLIVWGNSQVIKSFAVSLSPTQWAEPGSIMGFSMGAFGGLFIASLVFQSDYKLLSDNLSISIGSAQAFGRLGCFSNGCCFGIPTELPWGIKFPLSSMAGLAGFPYKLHPVQLYEAFACSIIAFGCWKLKSKPGEATAFYFVSYGALRFCTYYFRADGVAYSGPFGSSQFLAIFFVLLGFSVFIFRHSCSRGYRNPSTPHF